MINVYILVCVPFTFYLINLYRHLVLRFSPPVLICTHDIRDINFRIC